MIPQAYIAGAVALVLAGGGFVAGWKGSGWKRDSQQLAVVEEREAVAETIRSAVVEEVKNIRVRNVTVQQKAETITREVPVYRNGVCVHDERMRATIDEALAGPPSDRTGVP